MIRTMLFLLPFLVVTPGLASEQPTLAEIAAKLDLTSFPNSTGPRRQEGLVTPADYGFTDIQEADGVVTMTRADGKWLLAVRLLESGAEPIICITDRALNGGSYFSVEANRLAPKRNLYRVVETLPPRADCTA